MTNSEYEKIIKEGGLVEWYGEMVPGKLITPKVRLWSDGLVRELHILEGEVSDLKGVAQDKRKRYIKSLWNNVKNAPYTLNGDTYLIKKRRIEAEKVKKVKTTVKKTTNKPKTTSKGEKTVTKSTSTKNSNIIFGKNKK